MNVQGRNPFGIKRPSDVVINMGTKTKIRARVNRFVYRFKINNASFVNIVRTTLESAEEQAKRFAWRSEDMPGTIQLISITKLCRGNNTL